MRILHNVFIVMTAFFLFCADKAVADPSLTVSGSTAQGSLVYGKVTDASSVTLNGKKLRVDRKGNFVFGIGRDDGPSLTLKARDNNSHSSIAKIIKVKKKDWLVQKIDNLAPNMVEPSAEELVRINKENKKIRELREESNKMDFPLCFLPPLNGKTTSVFGSQRILNGIEKRPHGGIDIKAPAGTPVKAVADGKVVFTTDNNFYSGKMVIVDHGYGIFSTYAHLSKISVREGQNLKRQDPIGEVGSTGRSTGPHLHLGITWFNTAVDPRYVFWLSTKKCDSIRTGK